MPNKNKIEHDPEYTHERTWGDTHHPHTVSPYGPVAEYAMWRYSVLSSCWDGLDKKADDITRYAMSLVTALGIAGGVVGARYMGAEPQQAAYLIPSFGLALVAFVLAVRARTPSAFSIGGDVRRLVALAETNGADEPAVKAAIAVSLHVSTTGLRIAVAEKARQVKCAIYWLFASITAFSLLLWFAVR